MNFIEYLDENFTIHLVGGGYQYQIKGYCPFCEDDRNDLRLYAKADEDYPIDKRSGDCKHCGRGFSAIEFVAKNEKWPKSKAQSFLESDEQSFIKSPKAVPEVVLIYPGTVPVETNPAALDYAYNDRGLTFEIINLLGIEYCESNIELEDRLIYSSKRLIIPIKNLSGNIISWQGRDVTGKSKLKYLFPPGFKGAEYLYNSNNIKLNPNYLIICEGAMDCIGWIKAGFKNVVATFGKKCSPDQLRIIKNLKPKAVYIAWDTDANDKKYNFLEQKECYFESAKIIDLEGYDADELDKKTLQHYFTNAKGFNWKNKILGILNF